MKNLVEFAKNFCKENGHRLLFLTKFGSHLYGLNTEHSDTDYKGLFLPSQISCLRQEIHKSLTFTTGKRDEKNTEEDIDFDLWSVQYWLKLVEQGETNALDLLYSVTNKDCVVFCSPTVKELFRNPLQLFDPTKTKAYHGYAVHQAKKYGVKGSRLGKLKEVKDLLDNDFPYLEEYNEKFNERIVEHIVEKCGDESYCFKKILKNNLLALILCGRAHQVNIKFSEFKERVEKEYEKYGERARAAMQNEGIDWKAISHALRCILQMKMLLTEGQITYPLQEKEFLLRTKKGGYSWKFIEQSLQDGLVSVDILQKETKIKGKKDQDFIDKVLINMYK